MKKPEDVKIKLLETKKEIARIACIMASDASKYSDIKHRSYILRNGKLSDSNFSFNDALISFTAKMSILEWVLRN